MLAVIDNYDSFTWNLVQILGELGEEPRVFRNDTVTPAELRRLGTRRLVVSPGPCTPAQAGVSVEAIRELGPSTPTLGVCLGHQSIAEAYGGRTIRATRTVHGKVSPIRHNGDPLFDGIPSPMRVARYHWELCLWVDSGGFLLQPSPRDRPARTVVVSFQNRKRTAPGPRPPGRGSGPSNMEKAMPNTPIEVTPELVRTVDAMSWKGYLKLIGLFVIVAVGSITVYHYTSGNSEARFDRIEAAAEARFDRIEERLIRIEASLP